MKDKHRPHPLRSEGLPSRVKRVAGRTLRPNNDPVRRYTWHLAQRHPSVFLSLDAGKRRGLFFVCKFIETCLVSVRFGFPANASLPTVGREAMFPFFVINSYLICLTSRLSGTSFATAIRTICTAAFLIQYLKRTGQPRGTLVNSPI